jgi:hypothetical protein
MNFAQDDCELVIHPNLPPHNWDFKHALPHQVSLFLFYMDVQYRIGKGEEGDGQEKNCMSYLDCARQPGATTL